MDRIGYRLYRLLQRRHQPLLIFKGYMALQRSIVATLDDTTHPSQGVDPIGVGQSMLPDTGVDMIEVCVAADCGVHMLLFLYHADSGGYCIVKTVGILASGSGIGWLSTATALYFLAGGTYDGGGVLAGIDTLLT